MMHKMARTGLIFFLALLIDAVPLLAQNQTNKDANSKTSDSKEKNSKDKDKTKSKKKNSDVENIETATSIRAASISSRSKRKLLWAGSWRPKSSVRLS